MREIIFRGQTRRYGEKIMNVAGDKMPSNWVYGGIFQGGGDKSVIYSYEPVEKHVVYSDTVGQYVGINDKNGKKVFEGDIVTFFHEGRYVQALVHYDIDLLAFVCEAQFSLYTFSDVLELYDNGMSDKFEIIGNIYDNPDLIYWIHKDNK